VISLLKARCSKTFTGIIEETGTVLRIIKSARSAVLKIKAKLVLADLKLGDSLAVNGICLTVTDIAGYTISADIMPETLTRSSLGQLKSGNQVNLERALSLNSRFGGHIVSGHIDGTGIITQIKPDENAVLYTVTTPPAIMKYVVEKGSIAIDGISLTVVEVTPTGFDVSVIPHTMQNTILPQKKAGDTVNLENDIIGKYVEKLLINADAPPAHQGLSAERLYELGYF